MSRQFSQSKKQSVNQELSVQVDGPSNHTPLVIRLNHGTEEDSSSIIN
jgi:hypothetical protein